MERMRLKSRMEICSLGGMWQHIAADLEDAVRNVEQATFIEPPCPVTRRAVSHLKLYRRSPRLKEHAMKGHAAQQETCRERLRRPLMSVETHRVLKPNVSRRYSSKNQDAKPIHAFWQPHEKSANFDEKRPVTTQCRRVSQSQEKKQAPNWSSTPTPG